MRLRRSVLYVPADNPRALLKARELAADVVIVDLEDSVAPERKIAARIAARDALVMLRTPRHEVVLRINAADTPWHSVDVALAKQSGTAAVLPKVRAMADVVTLAERLGAPVWPMIETAAAVLDVAAIARAAARSGEAALVVGTNDLAAELFATPGADRAELAAALQFSVLAARAAGIDVIDGVFNDVGDADGLAAEAAAGRAMGMSGKSVVHPAQIALVNAAFAPDEAAVTQARAVVAAFEAAAVAGRSVATLDGRLIERLHVDGARRTLALAAAAVPE